MVEINIIRPNFQWFFILFSPLITINLPMKNTWIAPSFCSWRWPGSVPWSHPKCWCLAVSARKSIETDRWNIIKCMCVCVYIYIIIYNYVCVFLICHWYVFVHSWIIGDVTDVWKVITEVRLPPVESQTIFHSHPWQWVNFEHPKLAGICRLERSPILEHASIIFQYKMLNVSQCESFFLDP